MAPAANPLLSSRSQALSATGSSSDHHLLLSSEDPLLTWSWDVFALPLTGLSNVAGAAAAAEDGEEAHVAVGGGQLPRPVPALSDRVAAGEMRLAEAVVAMFRQFALLR